MNEIRCAVWNCSGFLPSSSAKEKLDFVKCCNSTTFDILILVETHHKTLDEISSLLHTYASGRVIHTAATEGDHYAGIAVLINTRLELVEHTDLLPGRLLNFEIKGLQRVYNITAMNGYTSSKASQNKITQMTKLLGLYHKNSDNNIILGDFNFVEYDIDRTNSSRSGKNQMDKTLSNPWKDFTEELGISDPFRSRNPNRRTYSYIHTKDNSKSRIDRIYVNDENVNEIMSYKHVPSVFCKAHKVVSFSIKEQCDRGPGFWKMNISILKDRAHKTLVESTISDVVSLGINDPIERWLVFKETIAIDTRAYCSKKRNIENKIRTMCEKNIEILEQNPTLSQNPKLNERHEFYMSTLSNWHRKEIKGYQARIKTQPRLEAGEPNISFYADLEKKESKKKHIACLEIQMVITNKMWKA